MKYRVLMLVLAIQTAPLAALCGPLAAASTPAPTGPALSSEQQRRLDGGHVVVLDVLPPGGQARGTQGGTAVALVQASPTTVWRVLVDYPHHTGLYPRVVDTQVLEHDANRSLVRYVVAVGPFSFEFHVNNYPEQVHERLSWRLAQDRPNDLFHESWGYWQIGRTPHGTIVTYAMAARTVLPAFMTRGAERDGLVATLRAVRNRAEQVN